MDKGGVASIEADVISGSPLVQCFIRKERPYAFDSVVTRGEEEDKEGEVDIC